MPKVVAALDCGSNSTRLLVMDGEGVALARHNEITRLSAGVDERGSLRADAMERTFSVLRRYRQRMSELGVTAGLLVATSAVRDAANGEDFLRGARAIVEVPCEILSGADEARYSYRGATSELDGVDDALVVDIGGGSTELAVVVDAQLRSFSMQLGCVRVAERELGFGVVTEERASATTAMIEHELRRAFEAEPALEKVVGHASLIGLAGTVATLVALERGLVDYERAAVHHQRVSREVVEHWRAILASETPAQRLAHAGMTAGREDVLVAGLYVLAAVMDRFGVDELLSSESDILDGITASLLEV
ncbi:MAG TPA: hypothetical protein PLG60_04055 [Acidimicrobiales bacterium]|nr:hypothetical protein [Acidimicrobiales bacterium]